MPKGSPERNIAPTSRTPDMKLSEKEEVTQLLTESPSVAAGIEGGEKKQLIGIKKEGLKLAKDLSSIEQELSKDKQRDPESWRNIVDRVKNFEDIFKADLDLLISTLQNTEFDDESEVPEEDLENLKATLVATRQFASRAFEERRFHAPNHSRPIKKLSWGPTRPFKKVEQGLSLAQEHEALAFARVPDKPKGYGDKGANKPHDSDVRDLMHDKLKEMRRHYAEFLRIGDRPLPDGKVIDRMKKEYELIQQAMERFKAFEDDINDIAAMPDLERITEKFPETVTDKLDAHFGRRNGQDPWFWRDDLAIPNPDRPVTEEEKNALAYEAVTIRERLAKIAEAYGRVIDAFDTRKI